MGPVLASSGCPTHIPWTVWVKQQEFWKVQSEARVQAWLGSGQSSFPALQKAAFSLCPHMAKRERERESERSLKRVLFLLLFGFVTQHFFFLHELRDKCIQNNDKNLCYGAHDIYRDNVASLTKRETRAL